MININNNKIVLDTNVSLDLFIFKNKKLFKILDLLEKKIITSITCDRCRSEFIYVLNYKKLNLNFNEKISALNQFDKVNLIYKNHISKNNLCLPLCNDSDDQKFIELTYNSNSSFLISKDKAILKLAKKKNIKNFFKIMSPESWLSEYELLN
tara:strand:+ start:1336 stop:1791 length:456 start_codon:yes stop_codon:yes gene_type:complete